MGIMTARCKLRLLTWTLVQSAERMEIRPTCTQHSDSKISVVDFGLGLVILCKVGNHLLAHCSQGEFDAEKEQASRQLNPGEPHENPDFIPGSADLICRLCGSPKYPHQRAADLKNTSALSLLWRID
jgi:hypothetical protein